MCHKKSGLLCRMTKVLNIAHPPPIPIRGCRNTLAVSQYSRAHLRWKSEVSNPGVGIEQPDRLEDAHQYTTSGEFD